MRLPPNAGDGEMSDMTGTPLPPTFDPERIAALLDGRLTGADREQVLAALAQSDESLELYADAVAALTAEKASASVPVRGLGGRRVYGLIGLALAASIGAILIVPALRRGNEVAESPARFASLLTIPAASAPPLWGPTRGGSVGLTSEQLAARVGVRVTGYELARRAGSPAAGALAADLARLMEYVSAGAPAVTLYRELAKTDRPADSLAMQAHAFARAAAGVYVDVGALLEASRSAALARDAEFFTRISGVPPGAKAGFDSIRVSAIESRPEWPTIELRLSTWLSRLTGA